MIEHFGRQKKVNFLDKISLADAILAPNGIAFRKPEVHEPVAGPSDSEGVDLGGLTLVKSRHFSLFSLKSTRFSANYVEPILGIAIFTLYSCSL